MYIRWKFTILLASLLLLLVLHPLIRQIEVFQRPIYYLFVAFVYVAVGLALFQRRKSRITALVLGIPAIAGILTSYLLHTTLPTISGVVAHVFPAIFLVYTVISILRIIFQDSTVSADSINGAFCGYFLLGIAFGHVYCLVDLFWPDSFHVETHFGAFPMEDHGLHALLTYFSLITLTTVGYGGITPFSPPARSLACVEAVIGQFYIAVIIAELIALKVSTTIREQTPYRPPIQ